jgi:hypothetical protein
VWAMILSLLFHRQEIFPHYHTTRGLQELLPGVCLPVACLTLIEGARTIPVNQGTLSAEGRDLT